MDFRNCDLITEIQDRSWYTDIKQRKGAGGMAAMNMNREQFDEMIRSGKTFLVDYWAPWCGYGRGIAPAYEKIAEQYKDTLQVVKVNIGSLLFFLL